MEFEIFQRIELPMWMPALAALGIFSFQFAWSDSTWPLVVSSTESSRTLQLGLAIFASNDGTTRAMLLKGR